MRKTHKNGTAAIVAVLLAASLLPIGLMGCNTDDTPDQVATPKSSPAQGAITAGQTITLTCATAGAAIYYTTNGAPPTANSRQYSSPFMLLSPPATVKAIAIKSGMTESKVLTAVYTLYNSPTPDAHKEMVSLSGGTITATTGSEVFSATETVIEPFSIAKYETTYQLWCEVYRWATPKGYIFANPGTEGHGATGTGQASVGDAATRATRPVTMISWQDAIVWCNAYSAWSGKTPVYYTDGGCTIELKESTSADSAKVKSDANGYRLPTEIEWEYAARGGDQSDTTNWDYPYAGSKTVGDVAWYRDNSYAPGKEEDEKKNDPNYGAHPVRTKNPNSKGLYDMSGNVVELCWNKYGEIGAFTSTSERNRVGRGGGWDNWAQSLEKHVRYEFAPRELDDDTGFRVVCSP